MNKGNIERILLAHRNVILKMSPNDRRGHCTPKDIDNAIEDLYIPIKLPSRNTLYQDFCSPLDKIQRVWLRRLATILVTPIILGIGVIDGFIKTLIDLYQNNW